MSLEACNGADDDCDRRVDEESAVACGTPFTCSAGTQACVGGAPADCVPDVAPGAEICGNMLDDDCDMAIDESCPCMPIDGTQPCGSGTGACRRGTQTCAPTGWGTCDGGVGSTTETCNGADDDCNGTVDGMTRPCSADVGTCVAGIETCTAGMFGTCSGVLPRAETCDAARLDEDCNGMPNNGCMCSEGDTQACGSCVGTQTCDLAGAWGMCVNTPRRETCNGIDDNCDGTTDEGTTCGMCRQVNNGTRSYLFCFDITRDWAGARAYCMTFGYDLVTVEDATENDWLNARERALHVNNVLWWYGGTDAAREGSCRWEPTMMPIGYTDWNGGEPNGLRAENCLYDEDRSSPQWSSDNCATARIFVCEDQDS